jgi:hypothetical protein
MFGIFRSNANTAPQFINASQNEQHPQRYCSDLQCSCHYDAAYHDDVTGLQQPSDEELSEALKFWQIANA